MHHQKDPSLALPTFSHPAQLCKMPSHELILMDESSTRGLAVGPCVILAS